MPFKLLWEAKFKILALVEKNQCLIEECLTKDMAEDQYQAYWNELYIKLKKISVVGTTGLPDQISRLECTNPKIWALKQGKIRLFYFQTEDGSIVLTNFYVKKSQKLDKKFLTKAIRVRKRYYESL